MCQGTCRYPPPPPPPRPHSSMLYILNIVIASNCLDPVNGDIRLNGTYATNRRGRVEVYYQGEWGTVCDDNWDDDDAEVVCRQLGFDSGAKSLLRATYGAGSGPIFLDEVQCYGFEERLDLCSHDGWGTHDCSHGEDASVYCPGEGE